MTTIQSNTGFFNVLVNKEAPVVTFTEHPILGWEAAEDGVYAITVIGKVIPKYVVYPAAAMTGAVPTVVRVADGLIYKSRQWFYDMIKQEWLDEQNSGGEI
jgi:hypothetical protein